MLNIKESFDFKKDSFRDLIKKELGNYASLFNFKTSNHCSFIQFFGKYRDENNYRHDLVVNFDKEIDNKRISCDLRVQILHSDPLSEKLFLTLEKIFKKHFLSAYIDIEHRLYFKQIIIVHDSITSYKIEDIEDLRQVIGLAKELIKTTQQMDRRRRGVLKV